jgi:hypothetical protein
MIRFHTRLLAPLLTLVILVALGAAIARAGTSAGPDAGGTAHMTFPSPALTSAATTFRAPHTLMVTGVDFTPGGRVEVALYDASGTALLETRWTTATVSIYVRDWRDDATNPSVGFTRAGVISEAFEISCGSTAKVRAYDQQTARWSDWLELHPGC